MSSAAVVTKFLLSFTATTANESSSSRELYVELLVKRDIFFFNVYLYLINLCRDYWKYRICSARERRSFKNFSERITDSILSCRLLKRYSRHPKRLKVLKAIDFNDKLNGYFTNRKSFFADPQEDWRELFDFQLPTSRRSL